jgi:hypothetical protein
MYKTIFFGGGGMFYFFKDQDKVGYKNCEKFAKNIQDICIQLEICFSFQVLKLASWHGATEFRVCGLFTVQHLE